MNSRRKRRHSFCFSLLFTQYSEWFTRIIDLSMIFVARSLILSDIRRRSSDRSHRMNKRLRSSYIMSVPLPSTHNHIKTVVVDDDGDDDEKQHTYFFTGITITDIELFLFLLFLQHWSLFSLTLKKLFLALSRLPLSLRCG